MNGLDGFSGNLLICIVGVFLTAVLACIGWLIIRSIDGFRRSIQSSIEDLRLSTKDNLDEIRGSINKVEADLEKARIESIRQFEKVRTDVEVKFSEIQRNNAQEQRDMELRWSGALKDVNERGQAHQQRVSEISEALLALKLDMYKDFMPTTAIREVVGELKSAISILGNKLDSFISKN